MPSNAGASPGADARAGARVRFLALHVDVFASRVTERGRSKLVEPAPELEVRVEEALAVLVSVERVDEDRPEQVVQAAASEIAAHAARLGVRAIVLHPFAHLFGELSRPEVAVTVLTNLAAALAAGGHAVTRTPFGWFNTLEVRAKGHPLSRVARIV